MHGSLIQASITLPALPHLISISISKSISKVLPRTLTPTCLSMGLKVMVEKVGMPRGESRPVVVPWRSVKRERGERGWLGQKGLSDKVGQRCGGGG